MKLTFKLEGVDQLRREMKRTERALRAELAAALQDEAKLLLELANRVAPTESGEMVRSGTITTEQNRDTFDVAVAYLDEKAAAVHEGFHGGRDSEGVLPGEKWFEQTLNEFSAGFERRMAERLRPLLGGS